MFDVQTKGNHGESRNQNSQVESCFHDGDFIWNLDVVHGTPHIGKEQFVVFKIKTKNVFGKVIKNNACHLGVLIVV